MSISMYCLCQRDCAVFLEYRSIDLSLYLSLDYISISISLYLYISISLFTCASETVPFFSSIRSDSNRTRSARAGLSATVPAKTMEIGCAQFVCAVSCPSSTTGAAYAASGAWRV